MADQDCRRAPMTREQYRASMKASAKGWFFCECCGKEAYRKQSGSNKSKGYVNRFCSMACRSDQSTRVALEIDGIRRIAGRQSREERARKSLIKSVAVALDKVSRVKARASAPCLVCSRPCGGGRTRPRLYCSGECKKKTEWYAKAKRESKARRKAIERGCKEARAIDPIKVFDRDGWRCQICLRATPKRLRGTHKDNAPELDHIIPIAKGGQHVWSNLQCACRSCNAAKSDKAAAGQMGLFTALMQ